MEADQKQMIDEMLAGMGELKPDDVAGGIVDPDPSLEGPPPFDPIIKVEDEPTDPPKVEDKPDTPTTTAPATAEPQPVGDSEPDPLDKDQIIEDLRNQFNELAGQFDISSFPAEITPPTADLPKPAEPAPASVVEPDKKPPQATFDPEDWLTKEELDNVVDNPKLINTALNRMVARLFNRVSDAFQPILDGLDGRLKEVPAQVTKTVQAQANTNSMMEGFYKNNEDLLPYAKFTNFTIASEAKAALASKEEITMDQLLGRAGDKARAQLHIAKPLPTKSTDKRPALPGARTTRQTKPTPQPGGQTQQDMMAEIQLKDGETI